MRTHLLGQLGLIRFALQWFANIFAFPVKRVTPSLPTPRHLQSLPQKETVKWAYKIKYVERFVCQLVARLFDSVSVLFATFFACLIYKKICTHCFCLSACGCVSVRVCVFVFCILCVFPIYVLWKYLRYSVCYCYLFSLCLLCSLSLSLSLFLSFSLSLSLYPSQ